MIGGLSKVFRKSKSTKVGQTVNLMSPEVGHPSISPEAKAPAGGHLPALDDDIRISSLLFVVNSGFV